MIKGHRNRSQNESARFSKSSINLKGFFTTGSLSKRIKTPKPSCTSDVIPDLHICSTIVTPSASMNLLPSASPKHAFRSTSKASSPRKYTQTPTSSSASFTRPEPHWFAPAEDFTPNLMSVETHSPLYQAVRKRISFTPEQFFVAPQLQLASEAVLQTQKSMGVTKIYEGTSLKRDVHETAKQTEMKEQAQLQTRLTEEQELTRQLSQRVGFDAEEITSLRREKDCLLARLRQNESELVFLGARCAALSALLDGKQAKSANGHDPSTPEHGYSTHDLETPILRTQCKFDVLNSPQWYSPPVDSAFCPTSLPTNRSPASTHTDSAFEEHEEDSQGAGHPWLGGKTPILSRADEAFLASSM